MASIGNHRSLVDLDARPRPPPPLAARRGSCLSLPLLLGVLVSFRTFSSSSPTSASSSGVGGGKVDELSSDEAFEAAIASTGFPTSSSSFLPLLPSRFAARGAAVHRRMVRPLPRHRAALGKDGRGGTTPNPSPFTRSTSTTRAILKSLRRRKHLRRCRRSNSSRAATSSRRRRCAGPTWLR